VDLELPSLGIEVPRKRSGFSMLILTYLNLKKDESALSYSFRETRLTVSLI